MWNEIKNLLSRGATRADRTTPRAVRLGGGADGNRDDRGAREPRAVSPEVIATEADLALIAKLTTRLRPCKLCGSGFHPATEASRLLFPGGERRQICLACESEYLSNTLEMSATHEDPEAMLRTQTHMRARSIQLRKHLAHREERLRRALDKVERERDWIQRQPQHKLHRHRLRALDTLGFREPGCEHRERRYCG